MPDPITGDLTPEEQRAASVSLVATQLAAHCRMMADQLAGSADMATARGAAAEPQRAVIEVWCDYEAAFAKRAHGRDMPRYQPRYPSPRDPA